VFSSQIERAHCKPWGLEGGGEATGNSIGLRIDGKWKEDFPNAKMVMANLKVGDAYVLRSGGGGGYGPAWERPADRVAEDVRQGYVSIDSAANFYGVIVDPKSFAIDQPATEKRRAELKKAAPAAAE
jgi:N-methylhydantoinase B